MCHIQGVICISNTHQGPQSTYIYHLNKIENLIVEILWQLYTELPPGKMLPTSRFTQAIGTNSGVMVIQHDI